MAPGVTAKQTMHIAIHLRFSSSKVIVISGNVNYSLQVDIDLPSSDFLVIFIFILWSRLQKSNAWWHKRVLNICSNWIIHKFVFCSLPIWETGYMVCWWLPPYKEQGMTLNFYALKTVQLAWHNLRWNVTMNMLRLQSFISWLGLLK